MMKPSLNSPAFYWSLHKDLHNSNGPSRMKGSQSKKEWYLYDVRLSQETFNNVKIFETEKAVPLWVAFLYVLNVIQDDELELFLKESGSWDTNFPINWVLKIWNVTDENFHNKVIDLHAKEWLVGQRLFTLDPLLKIIELEKNREKAN
jgi:hypothetical protein